MTRPREQQAARINVDDGSWRAFRILALEADRSLADYLGQLVREELRRAKRRAPASTNQPDDEPDTETRQPSAAKPESASRARLADAELLRFLPAPSGTRAK